MIYFSNHIISTTHNVFLFIPAPGKGPLKCDGSPRVRTWGVLVRNDIGQISERRQEEREMSGQERIESIRSIRELLIGGSDRVITGRLIRFCRKC